MRMCGCGGCVWRMCVEDVSVRMCECEDVWRMCECEDVWVWRMCECEDVGSGQPRRCRHSFYWKFFFAQ